LNADIVLEAARATLTGSMPFPEIVGKLMETGVEYYHVDYAARQIADDFDVAGLKAAVFDSQQNGQKFRQFSQRAMQAGVQGYFAFLRGKRVVYMGRQGDQHTEWFPGTKPVGN
jgi:uncharacterized protein YbcV (DUF1398 family)